MMRGLYSTLITGISTLILLFIAGTACCAITDVFAGTSPSASFSLMREIVESVHCMYIYWPVSLTILALTALTMLIAATIAPRPRAIAAFEIDFAGADLHADGHFGQ